MLRDSTPPVITLTASATRTDAESITLTATSEAGAQLAIEGQAGGTRTVQLAMGSNTFTATTSDRLGNQSAATFTVERIRAEPVPAAPPAQPETPAGAAQPVAPAPGTQPETPAPPSRPETPSSPANLTDVSGHWAAPAISRMLQ